MGCVQSHTESPLIYALSRKDERTAIMLIKNRRYLKMNTADGVTPLMRAIELQEKMAAYEFIMQSPELCSQIDSNGETALHYACRYNMIEILPQLNAASSPEAKQQCNREGHTPLMVAISQGHEGVALSLIHNHEWNSLHMDNEGNTLLIWACRNGMESVARALMHRHQNYLHRNKDNKTAIHYAQSNGLMILAHEMDHKVRRYRPEFIDTTMELNQSGPTNFRTVNVKYSDPPHMNDV